MKRYLNKPTNSKTHDDERASVAATATPTAATGRRAEKAVKSPLFALDDDDFFGYPAVDVTSAPGALMQLIGMKRNRDIIDAVRSPIERTTDGKRERSLIGNLSPASVTASLPMPAPASLSMSMSKRLRSSHSASMRSQNERARARQLHDCLDYARMRNYLDSTTTTQDATPETTPTTMTATVHGNPINEHDESAKLYCTGGYHAVAIGELLSKRYYVLRKLGWGHFSTVWLCWDAQLQRYCAAKIIRAGEHFSITARDEVRLLTSIDATHLKSYCPQRMRVIELLDTFQVSGPNGTHRCLIFEVLGDNLLTLIQRSYYRGLPLNNVKQVARQLLEGLDYLHSKCSIIHTDVKPENVLLERDDVQIRTQANQAAGEFIRLGQQYMQYCRQRRSQRRSHRGDATPPPTPMTADHIKFLRATQLSYCAVEAPKLSKTQKKRARAKIKRSLHFFQQHRALLRDQGIDDLLRLAERGWLLPSMVISAVTDQLGFMSLGDLQLLSADELALLARLARVERVGDVPQPPLVTKCAPKTTRAEGSGSGSGSNMVKLIMNEPAKFLLYAKERIKENDAQNDMPWFPTRRRRKCARNNRRRNEALPRDKRASKAPESRNDSNLFQYYGPNLRSRRDPAMLPCHMSVKIADMGNGCWTYHHFTDDIQTREYRAIEVILGAGYDTSADIWSVGCLLWELATGDYLFDPQFARAPNPDESHVAKIIEKCGSIPAELVLFGEYADDIFDYKGHLKHTKYLEARDLTDILLNIYFWVPERAREFTDFLRPMLCVDPKKRVTAADALRHRWLKIIDDQTKYQRHG